MAGWSSSGIALLGCLLIVMTLLDILTTAFHPTAQSVLTARFNRAVWYLVEHTSRPLPRRTRRWLLSWTLPATVGGLLLVWLLALLVGFALLYAPSMERSGAFVSTAGHVGWGAAFYLSGLCLTSIGFGDIVPHEALLRAATIAEGICGLVVVGVTVTYVLAVFPVLPLLRVLASTLNEETDGRVNALPMVRRYLAVDSAEALTQRCRELATQLRMLAEAHSSHPVLFYAHPKLAEQSFLRVLIVTQGLIGVLRYGLRQADHASLVRDPRVVGLEESFIAVLRQLGRSLHLQVQALPDNLDEERALVADFDAVLAALQRAGLREDVVPSRHERRAYVRFRLVTDPYIAAYRANTGYTTEELWGDHPPLRGNTAPFADEQDDEETE